MAEQFTVRVIKSMLFKVTVEDEWVYPGESADDVACELAQESNGFSTKSVTLLETEWESEIET